VRAAATVRPEEIFPHRLRIASRRSASPDLRPMSASGQKAKYSLGVDVFRFTPESGLN